MNLLHEDLFSFSSSSFPLPPSNPIVHIQTGKENFDCYTMNFNFAYFQVTVFFHLQKLQLLTPEGTFLDTTFTISDLLCLVPSGSTLAIMLFLVAAITSHVVTIIIITPAPCDCIATKPNNDRDYYSCGVGCYKLTDRVPQSQGSSVTNLCSS